MRLGVLLLLAMGLTDQTAQAQVPGLKQHTAPVPAIPGEAGQSQVVQDTLTHVAFELPTGWELARQDGELSTFHLDARSASRQGKLRAVAALGFNPFPRSTFSGALFYLSVTPRATAASCAAQATHAPMHPEGTVQVGDVPFLHGHDEHGKICTEARDEVYTALRNGSCIRFDLAMNSFCGGEVSGAEDLTPTQIDALEARLKSILQSVRFTSVR